MSSSLLCPLQKVYCILQRPHPKLLCIASFSLREIRENRAGRELQRSVSPTTRQDLLKLLWYRYMFSLLVGRRLVCILCKHAVNSSHISYLELGRIQVTSESL